MSAESVRVHKRTTATGTCTILYFGDINELSKHNSMDLFGKESCCSYDLVTASLTNSLIESLPRGLSPPSSMGQVQPVSGSEGKVECRPPDFNAHLHLQPPFTNLTEILEFLMPTILLFSVAFLSVLPWSRRTPSQRRKRYHSSRQWHGIHPQYLYLFHRPRCTLFAKKRPSNALKELLQEGHETQ